MSTYTHNYQFISQNVLIANLLAGNTTQDYSRITGLAPVDMWAIYICIYMWASRSTSTHFPLNPHSIRRPSPLGPPADHFISISPFTPSHLTRGPEANLTNNRNSPFILFTLVSLPVLPDLLHHFASDGFLNFLRHLVLEHKLGVLVCKGNQVCGRCGDEEKQRGRGDGVHHVNSPEKP